ncbi:hypothetical protein MRX96_051728 [Rhipicephalus microplus]
MSSALVVVCCCGGWERRVFFFSGNGLLGRCSEAGFAAGAACATALSALRARGKPRGPRFWRNAAASAADDARRRSTTVNAPRALCEISRVPPWIGRRVAATAGAERRATATWE